MSGLFNGTTHASAAAANAANLSSSKPKKPGKEAGKPSKVSAISDEQVKQMRALFDFRGWSKAEIAKHFEVGYPEVSRIIDCYTRAKVRHSEADLPKGY